MKYRVLNMIETLKRLPKPKYSGEVIKAHILVESWEASYSNPSNQSDIEVSTITLTAEPYARGSDRWLEWMIDL